MAKDDYFVVIYQILLYMYECLKAGKTPDWELISAESLGINQSYWFYIMANLKKDEYIDGIAEINTLSGKGLKDVGLAITPQGIAHLFDNNFISKAKRTLKDIKDMVPFA